MNETKWATIATGGNFGVRRWAEVRMGSGAVRGNRIWSFECGATAFGVPILTDNIKDVVQLMAIMISANLYITAETNIDHNTTVLRNLFLKYHPKGTFLSFLQSPEAGW